MEQLNENFIFEQGSDPDVLLIMFTGGYAKHQAAHPFDWLQVAGLYPYSKIYVRDPTKRMCADGVGGQLDSFDKLVDALRETAHRLKATRIITVGASAGTFPAILAAHLLKADYCHAFSPLPYVNLQRSILMMDKRMVRLIWTTGIMYYIARIRSVKYSDLGKELSNTNGHTRYYLHVCRDSPLDYKRAQYLANRPNVNLIKYPCNHHDVPRYLVRQRCMDKIFNIANQDQFLGMDFLRSAIGDG